MITRADPAHVLAGLRARGCLIERRASDLAFKLSDARELGVDHGCAQVGDGRGRGPAQADSKQAGRHLFPLAFRDLALIGAARVISAAEEAARGA